jgi:hypothetical protein
MAACDLNASRVRYRIRRQGVKLYEEAEYFNCGIQLIMKNHEVVYKIMDYTL